MAVTNNNKRISAFTTTVQIDKTPNKAKPENADAITNRLKRPGAITELTVGELATHISRGASFMMSICPQRNNESWEFCSGFCIDMDNDDIQAARGYDPLSSIQAVKRAMSYDLHPVIAFQTFSSSKEREKYRLVFLFAEPIDDRVQFERIAGKLLDLFPEADQSTVQGERLFFGTDKKVLILPDAEILPPEEFEARVAKVERMPPQHQPKVKAKGKDGKSEPFEVPDKIPVGQRHEQFHKMASSMRAKKYSYDAALAALRAENTAKCNPPFPDDELVELLDDVWTRYSAGPSKEYAPDEGNGDQTTHDSTIGDTPVRTFTDLMSEVNRDRPELIEGIMFERTVALIQGPSKSGKSTDECNMLVGFAGAWGGYYHGHKCKMCHVLYISTENSLDDFGNMILDCIARQPTKDMDDDELDRIIAESGVCTDLIHTFDISGRARPLNEIKDIIVRKANAIDGLEVIVFDSIYPILTGDENSNKEMADFVNLFNEILRETESGIVFVQHTSKGYQNYTDPISQSSGAGVFGRFPWTIVAMSEVGVKKETRAARLNIRQCECITAYLDEIGYDGAEFDADTMKVANDYRRACVDRLEPDDMNELIRRLDAVRDRVLDSTGVKITYRRRGARAPRPAVYWFEYPQHLPDEDGLLGGSKGPDGERVDRRKRKAQDGYATKNMLMQEAVDKCHEDGVPATRKNVVDRIGEFGGKEVTRGQINEWTRATATWSTWRCMSQAPYELYQIDGADGDTAGDDSQT